jgi:hypothetical protein
MASFGSAQPSAAASVRSAQPTVMLWSASAIGAGRSSSSNAMIVTVLLAPALVSSGTLASGTTSSSAASQTQGP